MAKQDDVIEGGIADEGIGATVVDFFKGRTVDEGILTTVDDFFER